MQTVHILVSGRALCGQAGTPNEWPHDHLWVAAYDAKEATCPACKAALRAKRKPQPTT